MFRSTYILLSCAALAAAHMELSKSISSGDEETQLTLSLAFPLPINSKFDKANTNPDYSMTTPLNGDGSNFPCKGYLGASSKHVTASFTAGQTGNFSLMGSATHGGGSCQVSLSYDNGRTFKVINSILGGCPLQSTYNFAVPSGLPAGNNVVFSWSWFNKVGNREFYQNCALVNIQGSGTQSYLSTLPDMQVANIGNGCSSVETIEVIPKNPGSFVQYGGSYAAGASAVNGNFGAGLTGTCGSASSNAVGAGNVNTPVAGTSSTTTPPTANAATTSPTTTVANAQTTSQPNNPAVVAGGSCSGQGGIYCTGIGYTWSQCANGGLVNMGAVAPGTICINGAMQFDTTGGKGVAAAVGAGATAVSTTTSKQPSRGALVTTTKTAGNIASPASTSGSSTGCISKRDARRECEDFSIKCSADGTKYSLCSGGVWASEVLLAGSQVCLDSYIQPVAQAQQAMVAPTSSIVCTGTGITCSEDGTKYFVCDQSDELHVPAGTKCLEGSLGGGFVTWSP